MKRNEIIYWCSTILIFLFEAVMPAFTFNTELAIEGIRHLGFPDYFRIQLTVFKVVGGLVLVVPKIPAQVKEWAYMGFAFTFISAAIAHGVVDGIGMQTLLPLVALVILNLSYVSYHKLLTWKSREQIQLG